MRSSIRHKSPVRPPVPRCMVVVPSAATKTIAGWEITPCSTHSSAGSSRTCEVSPSIFKMNSAMASSVDCGLGTPMISTPVCCSLTQETARASSRQVPQDGAQNHKT